MAIRDGKAYLAGLRDGREIWIDGERVADVTAHPRLGRGAHAIAALFDLQCRPELRDEMTYLDTTGEPVSLSFIEPRSIDDLVRRRKMFKRWADYSGGMLGRSPDFLRAVVTGLAINRAYLDRGGDGAGDRLYAYYERCRERDDCFTHALLAIPRDRGAAYVAGRDENELSLHIVDESAEGVVVRGARFLATGAPFADELLVMPAPATVYAGDRSPNALAMGVPIAMPGLKFICRESFDAGRSTFDHPLGARFEEMDAVAIFDDVLVPWERVFIHGDAGLAGGLFRQTTAYMHAIHQFMTKHLAKAELVLGVASLLAETVRTAQHPHIQAMLGEIAGAVETIYAFIRAAEADAEPDANGIYVPRPATLLAARDYFPVVYPRLVEILQLVGSSGLMTIPSEATFESVVGDEAEAYFQSATLGGKERVRLFRLAWDIACSSFGGRQVLYERFFTGDPFRNPATRYLGYDKRPAVELAEDLLRRC